jgi:hypothetical protein
MSYFTNEMMIKTVRFLFPEFEHGQHFVVFMGIEPDGTPASDSWIEEWRSSEPMPSIQVLKQTYIDNDLANFSFSGQPISQGAQTL